MYFSGKLGGVLFVGKGVPSTDMLVRARTACASMSLMGRVPVLWPFFHMQGDLQQADYDTLIAI
ncbi:hypothetical protein EGJ09_16095 [Pseudomonas sp. p106]|nr:hypothetical protein EGJ09_16095 [Pseudomonas sp. p106]